MTTTICISGKLLCLIQLINPKGYKTQKAGLVQLSLWDSARK